MIAWHKCLAIKVNSIVWIGMASTVLNPILHICLLLMIFLFKFGLPRAVDEVEVGLGRLLLHIFPHQVCPFIPHKPNFD